MARTSEGRMTVGRLRAGRWTGADGCGELRFAVRDKVVTTVHGTAPVRSATVELGPDGSLVAAVVDVDLAALDTGHARRDHDLAKPGLLDLGTHPVARAVAGATPLGEDGWDLDARLVVRGRECPVGLHAEVVGGDGPEVLVRVTGRVDRRPLGMRVPSVVIGRHVDVEVDLVLVPGDGS